MAKMSMELHLQLFEAKELEKLDKEKHKTILAYGTLQYNDYKTWEVCRWESCFKEWQAGDDLIFNVEVFGILEEL